MDDLAIARALHVLAVIHWIGGLALVTLVILPAIGGLADGARRLALFQQIEGRFSAQARASVTLAGISGFYMLERLGAWERLKDAHFWWMHAMLAIWALFSVVLFIAEPFFLHAWFARRAARDPDGSFALVLRAHWALLIASAVTIVGAVAGAHGAAF